MTRYISLNFLICSELIYVTYVAKALTALLRLDTFSCIMTRDSREKNSSIPNPGRGPPGRGPRPTAHRLRTAALGPATEKARLRNFRFVRITAKSPRVDSTGPGSRAWR